MLMERRLPNGEDITEPFERGDVPVLVPGIGDGEVDVDDVLGRQPSTDVEPTCSTFRAKSPSAARIPSTGPGSGAATRGCTGRW
jgi:hypothetical protein